MTIHRALSELKLIDSRIEKQTAEIIPSGIYQKDRLVNGHMKPEDFTSAAKSKFDSVTALIARKNAIKSAIVQANGVTKVKIGNTEMTIADAINFKAVIIFKRKLIASLKAKQQAAIAQLTTQNNIVDTNVQEILKATFGKENVKASKEDIEAVRKPYMEANTFHLIDPLQVNNTVEVLEKEVGDFEVEVDAALSEINAVTFIEI